MLKILKRKFNICENKKNLVKNALMIRQKTVLLGEFFI